MQKFRTKDGRLTAYALACGYVETRTYGDTVLRLWQEHGVYHVRAHDHAKGQRLFWDSFDNLTDARRQFDHDAKKLAVEYA